MTNNPMLHYKPGLTMDTPISVEMAAADWAILMAWFSNLPDEVEMGVKHIIYGVIGEQLTAALYTAASVQGAKAHYHEQRQEPMAQLRGFLTMPAPRLDADDAAEENSLRCQACQRIIGAPSAPCLLCPDYGV